MHFTPLISIYREGTSDFSWIPYTGMKAIWIFSKHLGYIKKLSSVRVNIHVGDEERTSTETSIKSIWIKNSLDVNSGTKNLDHINHALAIVHKGMRSIGELQGWDLALIDKAYADSIASNGDFEWTSPFKSNKARTKKGRIRLDLGQGNVGVIAEIFDKKENFLFASKIIDTYAHFIDYEKPFSRPQWIDDEKFGFSLIKNQLLLFANTTSQQTEIVINENSLSEEELEGRLRMLTFKVFSSHEEFIKWANR